jgi:hypothetical protein
MSKAVEWIIGFGSLAKVLEPASSVLVGEK